MCSKNFPGVLLAVCPTACTILDELDMCISFQTAVAQTLMSMDHVSFRLTPVAGYLDFKTIFEKQIADDENVRDTAHSLHRLCSYSAILTAQNHRVH